MKTVKTATVHSDRLSFFGLRTSDMLEIESILLYPPIIYYFRLLEESEVMWRDALAIRWSRPPQKRDHHKNVVNIFACVCMCCFIFFCPEIKRQFLHSLESYKPKT